jgi:hypothetical protein
MKKLLLLLTLLVSVNTITAQKELLAIFGATKDDIISLSKDEKRIPTGDYYSVAYELGYNSATIYMFDEQLKCKAVIIRKPASELDRAKLILAGDYLHKSKDGMDY